MQYLELLFHFWESGENPYSTRDDDPNDEDSSLRTASWKARRLQKLFGYPLTTNYHYE